MFAVIRTGGKQYKVQEGDVLTLEKLAVDENSEVIFDDVLLVSDKEGTKVTLGTPVVSSARVTATVLQQGRAKKIHVIKYKNKTRSGTVNGHRQSFTRVKIEKIAA